MIDIWTQLFYIIDVEKITSALIFIFSNFGPLVIFSFANHFFGLKIAIAASLVFLIAEVLYQKSKKKPISEFFIFSAVTSIVFGVVDLTLTEAVLFNYEAVITNVITGFFFIYGAFKKKPLIQEFAEKREKFKNGTSPDLIHFFRIFTLVWATYFFMKAAFYVWVAAQPISTEEKIAIRSTIGGGSLYALIALSTFGGRRMFHFFKRLGWLPENA